MSRLVDKSCIDEFETVVFHLRCFLEYSRLNHVDFFEHKHHQPQEEGKGARARRTTLLDKQYKSPRGTTRVKLFSGTDDSLLSSSSS